MFAIISRTSRRIKNLSRRHDRLLASLDPDSPFDTAHRNFLESLQAEIYRLERRYEWFPLG